MGWDVKDLRSIQNRGVDRNGTSPEGMTYRLIREWRHCYKLTIQNQNVLSVCPSHAFGGLNRATVSNASSLCLTILKGKVHPRTDH
jgi:hypothetical protein